VEIPILGRFADGLVKHLWLSRGVSVAPTELGFSCLAAPMAYAVGCILSPLRGWFCLCPIAVGRAARVPIRVQSSLRDEIVFRWHPALKRRATLSGPSGTESMVALGC